MDNYRRPMYSRNNRNMGSYQNAQSSCGATPVMEAGKIEHCDDDYNEKTLSQLPLAMAYVPFQKWRKVCDGATGLANGTIFQELVLPFYGDKNGCGMRGDRS